MGERRDAGLLRERRRAHRWVRRVITLLHKSWKLEIRLADLRKGSKTLRKHGIDGEDLAGCLVKGHTLIFVDYRRSQIVETIVHECLHKLIPTSADAGTPESEKNHALVYELEALIMANLTYRLASDILYYAARRLPPPKTRAPRKKR